MLLAQPTDVPHTMLSSRAALPAQLSTDDNGSDLPQTMLSSSTKVPQTMLSSSSANIPHAMSVNVPVPHTMLSAHAAWCRSTTLLPSRTREPQMTVCVQGSWIPPKVE